MTDQNVVTQDQFIKDNFTAHFAPLYAYIRELESQPGSVGSSGGILLSLFESAEAAILA